MPEDHQYWMRRALELAREAGIQVHEITLTKHDVYIADECFLTGTAAEVIAVVSLDGRTIGGGSCFRVRLALSTN